MLITGHSQPIFRIAHHPTLYFKTTLIKMLTERTRQNDFEPFKGNLEIRAQFVSQYLNLKLAAPVLKVSQMMSGSF